MRRLLPFSGCRNAGRERLQGWRIAALVLPLFAVAPADAGQLLDGLKDRTFTCGLGSDFYLDRAGTTLLVAGYGTIGGTGIAETKVALRGTALLADEADRLEIAVSEPKGSTRLRFRRAAGRPGSGKIELLVGDDTVGDECVIGRGRQPFVAARFNSIRENLCGNDPSDACIAALERSCGSWPEADCVRRTRPALERIKAQRR